MLTLGEVHTTLLLRAGALGGRPAADALDLVPGGRVRRSERPNRYAVSAEQYTGVDCGLRTGPHARTRGVGTVAHHAVLVGGRVVQGSAYTTVVRGRENRRLAWSHYLASPGVIETIGRADARPLADGFLGAPEHPDSLHLGAISDRMIDSVQQRGADEGGRPPVRGRRLRLRWTAIETDERPGVVFGVDGDHARTARLRGRGVTAVAVAFCEDLALHDWLITTVTRVIDGARIGVAPSEKVVGHLRPAAESLLDLWMPGARADAVATELWTSLENHPGFSRQWLAGAHRVRDQLALGACAPPGRT
ncbi:MAG: hypothetical protein HOV79_13915 [Hamadaea sp.]|nr:hypothetical protein [Hamadaea sp.]